MLKELSKDQMNLIVGGVSVEEYCDTMWELIQNNIMDWDSATCEGANEGTSQYCGYTVSC